jgi:hypothetical protein
MKLFEEIARSLRLVKGVHQPEVLEPETPTSASEFEIIVPSDAAARHAGFSPELRDTIRVIRHDVLATLRQVPAFVSAAQKMASEGCLYRVLVSEEHVHLLREGADGIVNPFLRDAAEARLQTLARGVRPALALVFDRVTGWMKNGRCVGAAALCAKARHAALIAGGAWLQSGRSH